MTHPPVRARLGALLLIAGASLGGCRQERTAEHAPAGATSPSVVPTNAWIGKWVGVEGLALDIQPRGAAGRYRLIVTTMDSVEQFAGWADGDVIRFTRHGRSASIRRASGAETGLKWLAGKRNCLVIQPGEGFCRG